jgi:hypothetical protein
MKNSSVCTVDCLIACDHMSDVEAILHWESALNGLRSGSEEPAPWLTREEAIIEAEAQILKLRNV